ARFMKSKPEIDLTLVAGGSKQVWILGDVRGPGVYSLTTPLTVLGAVAAAQGFSTPEGSSEETVDLRLSFIMRKGQPLPVDFYSLIKNGDLTQNIYLLPDDFLFFRAASNKEVYVLGAVPQPNAVPYKPGSSLVSVITAVGGPIQYAHLTQVAVIRGSISDPAIAVVDFKRILAGDHRDIRLEPGDIVYIPFSPFMKLERLAEQIVTQFVRTVAVNEGKNAVSQNRAPISVAVPIGQ
ncbi:MAG: SLBB domain-containing protein, partial [Verrucomicrobiales bacterium]